MRDNMSQFSKNPLIKSFLCFIFLRICCYLFTLRDYNYFDGIFIEKIFCHFLLKYR